MSRAIELVEAIEAAGGRLTVEDQYLVIVPRRTGEPLADELRLYKPEIIELLLKRSTEPTEVPLDEGWGEWLLERCVFRDRWWGGIGALQLDFARWCADHARPLPASRRTFVEALRGEGFQATSDGFVYGLVLKEDLLAHERFQQMPTVPATMPAHPTPAKRRNAKARFLSARGSHD